MSDLILLAHSTFGALGVLAAVWVLVETLNASPANRRRIRLAAFLATGCILLASALGGYWYTVFYAREKAIILNGPWPWAHSLVMATKAHLVLIALILALYLPIAAAANLSGNRGARAVVLAVTALLALSGLAIEGAGAVVSFGVKIALVHVGVEGVGR